MIRKVNLQGLVENMAFGMCFWSSSVKYLGKEHLGSTVDGPENASSGISSSMPFNVRGKFEVGLVSLVYLHHQDQE